MDGRKSKGFTLTELLVVLMVVAIFLSIGVPAFNELVATNRVATSVNDLVSSMHLARSEAVKRKTNATICASTDWNTAKPTCDPIGKISDGWIVFADCTELPPAQGGNCGAPNLIVEEFDTVVSIHGPLPDSIAESFTVWPMGKEYVSFGANGFSTESSGQRIPKTDVQLCDSGNAVDTDGTAAGPSAQVTDTGRAQVYGNNGDVRNASNPLNGC